MPKPYIHFISFPGYEAIVVRRSAPRDTIPPNVISRPSEDTDDDQVILTTPSVANGRNNTSHPSPGIEQMFVAGGEAVDRHMEEIRNIGADNSRVSALTGPASAQEFNPLEWDLYLPPRKLESYHSLSKNKMSEVHTKVS